MSLDGVQIWPALIIGIVIGWVLCSKKKTGAWY